MFSDMSNAATALRNFWLWKCLFSRHEAPVCGGGMIVPLISRYDLLLNDLINQNPVMSEFHLAYVQHVQRLARQLQKGIIPSLQELADAFPEGADTMEAKHLLLRYTYFLNHAGKLGRMRGEQLNLLIQLRSRESLLRHMAHICTKYSADSIEGREFRSCVSYLKNTLREIEQVLIPLLEEDPSHGETIDLKWADRYQWFSKFWNKLRSKVSQPFQRLASLVL
jgi:hypothetical protein